MNRLGRIWATIDRQPTLTDGVAAAVLCAFALLSIRLAWPYTQPHPVPGSIAVALTLLLILPLTWRRRFPLATLAVMTSVAVVYRLADVPEQAWSINAWWLALFSAGAYGADRWRNRLRGVAVMTIVGLIVYELFLAVPANFEGDLFLTRALSLSANAVIFVWIWWLGDMMRIRRERDVQLSERTGQLEREREQNARRAVIDERIRIARELHDVVAHHVSLMGVQAGAARRVLTRYPDKAEEALSAIEGASRQAVLELHRLLGFLRREDEEDGLAPQPTLRQLDALVVQMREAGLPVEVKVDGEERPLPPAVDLSAYRIVQEALTNTLKHAGPARAVVVVRYGTHAVEIEVVDDGHGATPANLHSSGNGLMGMRERVGLLGGCLSVDGDAGDGFAIRARLPFDGQSA